MIRHYYCFSLFANKFLPQDLLLRRVRTSRTRSPQFLVTPSPLKSIALVQDVGDALGALCVLSEFTHRIRVDVFYLIILGRGGGASARKRTGGRFR